MTSIHIRNILCASAALLLTLPLVSCAEENGETKETSSAQSGETNVEINIGKETETTPSDGGTTAPESEDATEPAETAAETEAETAAEAETTSSVELGKFTESDLGITVNGVRLEIGEDFLPYVDVLGKAEIVEGQACLGGGYDTNYYYGGEDLVVYTLAKDGKQIIYDIYLSSADYATDKGARVGETTREQLAELYGEATNSYPVSEEYGVDGSDVVVSFSFEEDVLTGIDILDSGVN